MHMQIAEKCSGIFNIALRHSSTYSCSHNMSTPKECSSFNRSFFSRLTPSIHPRFPQTRLTTLSPQQNPVLDAWKLHPPHKGLACYRSHPLTYLAPSLFKRKDGIPLSAAFRFLVAEPQRRVGTPYRLHTTFRLAISRHKLI